jgi:hypothetical protein
MEQEIKKELVNKIELDLTIKGEILKSQDLINHITRLLLIFFVMCRFYYERRN